MRMLSFRPASKIAARPSFKRLSTVRPMALLKEDQSIRGSVTWHQSTDEVMIFVPIEDEVRGKDIRCDIKPKRLSLVNSRSGVTLLEGPLEKGVNADDSFWSIEASGKGKNILITLAKKEMGYGSWNDLLDSEKVDPVVTDRAFLEVKIGDEVVGKLSIGLFGTVCPQTVKNFVALCNGDNRGRLGSPLDFRGSPFHRIIDGFMAQGGDITKGDGTGGESIYGEKFEDENFKLRHDTRGLVAMANAGPNTNNSQFYITFGPTPHLDGKHVVFGKVEAGLDILNRIEAAGSESGEPSVPVVITDCGAVSEDDIQKLLDDNKQISMKALY